MGAVGGAAGELAQAGRPAAAVGEAAVPGRGGNGPACGVVAGGLPEQRLRQRRVQGAAAAGGATVLAGQAGRCAGPGRLGVDVALLRLLLVAATLFGLGIGAVLYVVSWILVPEED